MFKKYITGFILIVVFAFGGCEADRMSQVGFSLPAGDIDAGREAFRYLECHQCHTIVGEEFEPIPLADPPYVELGGTSTKVKTYGQLVTAIIDPTHDIAKKYAKEIVTEDGVSKMPNYNGIMTVQELIDIVRFLQPHYEVVIPRFPLMSPM